MVLMIDMSVESLVLKTAICVNPCLEDCNLCDGIDDFHVRGGLYGLDDLDDLMFMMTLMPEGSLSMILAVTVVFVCSG
jgi:hypothetical protein